MSKGDPILLLPVAALFSSLFTGGAVHFWRRHLLLRRAPLQPITAASSSGVVAIEGRIVASAAVLTAPMSGVAAVYYRTEMSGLNSKVFLVEEEKVPFEIEDGSGARASVSLDSTFVKVIGVEGKWNASSAARLAPVRRRADATGTRPMRYSEKVLEVGQIVFVVGPARRVGGEGGGNEYRSGSVRLAFDATADPGEPLVVAAGSGEVVLQRISREAWALSALALFCALMGALILFARC